MTLREGLFTAMCRWVTTGVCAGLCAWSQLVSAGQPDTAGERQAREQLDAVITQHQMALQQSADATTRRVSGSVSAAQQRQQRQLSLQLRIDALRASLGAEVDPLQRQRLSQQIQQLEALRARG